MTSHYLIILGIIWFLPSTDAQISPCNEKISLMNHRREVLVGEVRYNKGQGRRFTPPQNPGDETSTHLRSRRTRRPLQHRHSHLRTVHGIVNIVGWGILLPIGVIAARYFKKLTLENNNEWYSVHVVSQISGFILGTIGWGLGISIRTAARKHSMNLHGILGTIIFALTAIQVTLGLRLRVNQEPEFSKKLWAICHHLVGYVLIVLIIANIFEGIENQSPANKWNWSYGVILGTFSFVALALELQRWIRFHAIDLVAEDIHSDS